MRTARLLFTAITIVLVACAVATACGDNQFGDANDEWAEGFCTASLDAGGIDSGDVALIEQAHAVYHRALIDLGPPPTDSQSTRNAYQELVDAVAQPLPTTTTGPTTPGVTVLDYRSGNLGAVEVWQDLIQSSDAFYDTASADIPALRPGYDKSELDGPYSSKCEELQSLLENSLRGPS